MKTAEGTRVLERARHRAQWLAGARALVTGLIAAPVSDPVMGALRRVLAPDGAGDLGEAALAAVRRHEVEVLVSARVPGLAAALAAEVAERRRAAAILELAQEELTRDLAGVPAVWLKGAATWRLYPEGAWRTRRDLDLLVGEGIAEVRLRLLARGWVDAVTPRRAAAGPLAVRAWPMTRAYGPFGVSLDLHRQVGPAWCGMDAAAMLAGGWADEDVYLSTVAHLVGAGFHEPIKGWVDLAWLAPRIDPERLVARARRFRMEPALWLAVHVLARWFPGTPRVPVAISAPRAAALARLAAGDHDTPERRPLYKGLSQRLWRALLA